MVWMCRDARWSRKFGIRLQVWLSFLTSVALVFRPPTSLQVIRPRTSILALPSWRLLGIQSGEQKTSLLGSCRHASLVKMVSPTTESHRASTGHGESHYPPRMMVADRRSSILLRLSIQLDRTCKVWAQQDSEGAGDQAVHLPDSSNVRPFARFPPFRGRVMNRFATPQACRCNSVMQEGRVSDATATEHLPELIGSCFREQVSHRRRCRLLL